LRDKAIRAPQESSPAAESLVARDGARARRTAQGLRIEGRDGEVLCEYDASRGCLVLRGEGGVVIDAGDGVLALRGAAVSLEGARSVSLRVTGEQPAEVSLDHRGVTVAARALAVAALRAVATLEESSVTAGVMTVVGRALRQRVGVVETRAERVITRAKEVYTEADELAQTRAGRLRLHARETLQAVADRLLLRADDDVKVQGERVHLG
jgi:hypothetical protein